MLNNFCYNLKANVYKMMYFWYKTSVILSKMYKGISNHVESVKRKRGTFIMHGKKDNLGTNPYNDAKYIVN